MGALVKIIADTHRGNDYVQDILDPGADIVLCLPGDLPDQVDIIMDVEDAEDVEAILDLFDITYGAREAANDAY